MAIRQELYIENFCFTELNLLIISMKSLVCSVASATTLVEMRWNSNPPIAWVYIHSLIGIRCREAKRNSSSCIEGMGDICSMSRRDESHG
jgi:hypothetical protein